MHRVFLSLSPLVCVALCGLVVTPFRTPDASAAPPEVPTPKAAPVPAKANTSGIEYNRDIRPILAENCFACHGADSATRKGGLRIDRREDAVEATAVVPGKPTESEMIRRILLDDNDKELMPPVKSNKKLKPGQWFQWNAVLADTNATAGYVRVKCLTAACQFIAYAVNNDGSVPGAGTSDGSYIPMVNAK